jgi:subfamily B ATP-binding cassette protein MsbA
LDWWWFWNLREGMARHEAGDKKGEESHRGYDNDALHSDMTKKYDKGRAWLEARQLIADHRRSLTFGLVLMVITRLSGFVLPWTSKFLIDDIIGKHRADLLLPLAGAAIVATLIQGATSFWLSQVVSIAAQRAITEMRKRVQAHVLRLPISYFDSTKTGVLISRIMTDAEGVRNLVGTGLIQLLGSTMTALMAMRMAMSM